MIDFTFENPAKIIFGRSALSHLGEEVKRYSDKVLVVYGGGSIKKLGLYDQVMDILKECGAAVWELAGIVPNPLLSRVYEGIEICRKNDIGLVLAVGGGSSIDTAKGIANGVCYDGDVWDFYAGKKVPEKALPLGTILTIPAAGSEMSYSSVITKEDGMLKNGFNSLTNVPKFSLLNPEYSFTLPPYQTACGCVDILAHMMERYFTTVSHVELMDAMLEACMRTLIAKAPVAFQTPDDYDSRAEIMWTGSLAHNTLLQTGRIGDWASHRLEHELSALYDVAHGAGLSIIIPAWLKFVMPLRVEKVQQFAEQVMGVAADFGTPKEIAAEGIRRLEKFYQSLNMPIRMSQADIPGNRIEEMSVRAIRNGTLGNFVPINEAEALAIYRLAQ